MPTGFRIVLLTAPRGKKTETLARGLVSERLAACVNVTPAISHYRWNGRLRRDAENLLIAKTTTATLPALLRWIAAKHPYSVPEVIALPIVSGSKAYLKWLASELS